MLVLLNFILLDSFINCYFLSQKKEQKKRKERKTKEKDRIWILWHHYVC